MKKNMIISMVVAVFAWVGWSTDGTWNVTSTGSWSQASNWLNGVIPNDGGIAYLTAGMGNIAVDIPVTLTQLESAQPRTVYHSGTGQLYMVQSPVMRAGPYRLRSDSFTLGSTTIGDGSEIVLTGGATFNFESGASFTNFSCVTVRETSTISLRQSSPLSWSDLRLEQTRLNNNSKQYVLFTPCMGSLFVGAGANAVRIGYFGPMALPSSIVREAYGTLQIAPNTNRVHMVNGAAYMDSYGRLPAWLFRMNSGDGTYNFSTYDTEFGIVPFASASSNINATASTFETVYHMMGGQLEQDVHVDALNVGLTNLAFNGKTVTLGNAGTLGTLLLNKDLTDASGALTFASNEGLIVANADPVRIAPQITGPMTLSILAGVDNINATGNRTIRLSNTNNTFTGGLHILVGRVMPESTNANVFGSGDIWVHGLPGTFTEPDTANHNAFGGQLYLLGGVLTNRLYLSGQGSEGFAALRLSGNVTVASEINVTNRATIRVDTNTVAALTGEIKGNSLLRLFAENGSTLTVSRPMSYTGGTYIGAPQLVGSGNGGLGDVRLAANATLGTGPIVNHGSLVIDRTEDWTVASLTGTGRVVKADARQLTFSVPVQINGAILDAGETLLSTGTNTIGYLGGQRGARVAGAAGTVTLLLGNDESRHAEFSGMIANGSSVVGIVKKGANTQILSGTNTYSGPTVVQAGTLKLKGYLLDDFPLLAESATLRLDAARRANTVSTNSAGFVTQWQDSNVPSLLFTQANPLMQPTYDAAAVNGVGAIRFAGGLFDGVAVTNRLSCVASSSIFEQTIYAVSQPLAYRTFDGLIGSTGGDVGIRLSGLNNWDSAFPRWGVTGNTNYTINGRVSSSAFPSGKPHLMRTRVTGVQDIGKSLSIGQFFDNTGNYPRAFNGYICEIVMFKRLLTDGEDSAVSTYLMNKWGITNSVSATQQANILPVASPVTIQSGAALDLNGARQTFASLSCFGGTLRNSSEKAADLEIQSGEVSAVLQGALNMTKSSASTVPMTIGQGSSYTGVLTVSEGTLLLQTWKTHTLPVTSGRTFQLDASDVSSVVTNAGGEVTTWKNLGSTGGDFAKDPDNRTTLPLYSSGAFGGRGGLWFRGDATTITNRLTSTTTSTLRTIFFVTQTDGYTSCAGLFGPRNDDSGIRLSNSSNWDCYRSGATDQGFGYASNYFVNGVNTRTFTPSTPYIFMVRGNQPNWSKSWTLGNHFYWLGGIATRSYNGLVGEVIAYDRTLTPDEQQQVEAYLTKKWINARPVDANMLATSTQLVLGNTATLDLGRMDQTVQSVSGGGVVTNGALTISGAVQVAADGAGDVDALGFDTLTVADGAKVTFTGTPKSGSLILQANQLTVNASTLQVSAGWMLKAKDNGLYLYRTGSLMIVR